MAQNNQSVEVPGDSVAKTYPEILDSAGSAMCVSASVKRLRTLMAEKSEMLPGTVATVGCEPFGGYSEDKSSAVLGRGNHDIAGHRFHSTISAVKRLQEEIHGAEGRASASQAANQR